MRENLYYDLRSTSAKNNKFQKSSGIHQWTKKRKYEEVDY